jgi:hypothetical protein
MPVSGRGVEQLLAAGGLDVNQLQQYVLLLLRKKAYYLTMAYYDEAPHRAADCQLQM